MNKGIFQSQTDVNINKREGVGIEERDQWSATRISVGTHNVPDL